MQQAPEFSPSWKSIPTTLLRKKKNASAAFKLSPKWSLFFPSCFLDSGQIPHRAPGLQIPGTSLRGEAKSHQRTSLYIHTSSHYFLWAACRWDIKISAFPFIYLNTQWTSHVTALQNLVFLPFSSLYSNCTHITTLTFHISSSFSQHLHKDLSKIRHTLFPRAGRSAYDR